MAAYSNHLAQESSPYLQQHAHNPVDWYPWGDTALDKAISEDKPILVSIGYAACHWCHVMERESFEDADTAAFMNEHFVNIKIDREERPDLDHIYMGAVQTLTGAGGWPLNVFLTPQKKPFYGGTYFPPEPMYNRPSWKQVLMGVVEAFYERREKLEGSAEDLTRQLIKTSGYGLSDAIIPDVSMLDSMYSHIMQSADKVHGGFGGAPKFPQVFSIQYLFKYHYYRNVPEAFAQALLSLDKMVYGGIYDQLGGGFARYATDAEWLVPHFEKMLYDNALLVQVLCEAFQQTGKTLYKHTIATTLDFVQREMMSVEGGFYSALDADSEGVEGKYYVWDKKEIDSILGEDAEIFCRFYNVTVDGNWEDTNILNIPTPPVAFAETEGISLQQLESILKKGRDRLWRERNKRVRPLLDDKILLGWNAMMNLAYTKAYAATGEEHYLTLARKNMMFIFNSFFSGSWHHGYKNGIVSNSAFLDDYASLIEALIHFQEVTGDQSYLEKAKDLTEIVLENFHDGETGLFFFTHKDQRDVIFRSKDTYDGSVPSGNATMASNLQYLSLIFDNNEWGKMSEKMMGSMMNMVTRYPTSFGRWACLITGLVYGKNEIAIVGSQHRIMSKELLLNYLPDRVLQSSENNNTNYPLLQNKLINHNTNIYLCNNYTCKNPVTSVAELLKLLVN